MLKTYYLPSPRDWDGAVTCHDELRTPTPQLTDNHRPSNPQGFT